MTLNEIGRLFLELAEEKGWGHSKETLIVSEKMMLICTEIDELYEAVKKNRRNSKDSMEAESADILGRTLHLGLAWKIDFDTIVPFRAHFRNRKSALIDADYVYLYSLVSKGYDYYRHKNISMFKRYLYKIAHEMILLANSMNIDIEAAVLDKVNINKSRIWNKKRLNGNYYKEK